MGKKESTLPNMAVTLIIITIIAGASLGYIYNLTANPIASAKQEKQQNAIQMVVPEFDNNPVEEMYKISAEGGDSLNVFPAKKDGSTVGVAIESISNKGFSGDVKIMVGILPDGTINNYVVLEHKETPGLGTKMDTWFKPSEKSEAGVSGNTFANWLFGIKSGQAEGRTSIIGVDPSKTDLAVSADGGDIDAITAATISSRAFLDAVQKAWVTYTEKADGYSSATTKNNDTEEGGTQ